MSLIIPVYKSKCQTKSWKNYLKEAISDPKQLLSLLSLKADELDFELDLKNDFAMRVPEPYIDKIKPQDSRDPLLLQVLSQKQENLKINGFSTDPLEEKDGDTPGLLHKYHGRVLLILSSACAINCRYCFRRHFPYHDQVSSGDDLQNAINYIRRDQGITEVILSGGDPLVVSDNSLSLLVKQLNEIPHLKRLRIHTRLPIVIPQRITPALCNILEESPLQVSMVLHINHANEIDQLLESQLKILLDAGVVLFNQSVLLKDINDSEKALCDLSEKLFSIRVVPYYLHLLDKVQGAAHFAVTDEKALELIELMRAKLPGYLVPRLAKEEVNRPAKTIIG